MAFISGERVSLRYKFQEIRKVKRFQYVMEYYFLSYPGVSYTNKSHGPNKID